MIEDSRSFGISIGHRDTDNFIRDNEIVRSGKVGVEFRNDSRSFAAHRTRLENNGIVDSGPEDGIGIDVQGQTESVTLVRNQLRETREPKSRVGVRIGARTQHVKLTENRIDGFAVAVRDLRKP